MRCVILILKCSGQDEGEEKNNKSVSMIIIISGCSRYTGSDMTGQEMN